jgi:hypothetical protein
MGHEKPGSNFKSFRRLKMEPWRAIDAHDGGVEE